MRIDSSNFQTKNANAYRKLRAVVEFAFNSSATDLHYITTHSDCASPDTANTTYGAIHKISGFSSKYNPRTATTEIGSLTVDILDINKVFSLLLQTKLNAGKSLRKHRVRVYVGFEGLAWADYSLVQTQLVYSKVVYNKGIYSISCRDIQREEKNKLFRKAETNIAADISLTSTVIQVGDVTGFEMLAHSESFQGNAPGIRATDLSFNSGDGSINSTVTDFTTYFVSGQQTRIIGSTSNDRLATITSVTTNKIIIDGTTITESAGAVIHLSNIVGYIEIKKSDSEKEIIGYRRINTGSNQFELLERGLFGTKELEITRDTTIASNRQPKVTEYIYLEMPLIKLIYALETGALLNQPGETLPSGWGDYISSSYIRQTDFVNIGNEWYKFNDDTKGFKVKFEQPSEERAKSFIEKELCLLVGGFRPIYANGEMGFKLGVGILKNAPYSRVLDKRNIIAHSGLTHDYNEVRNDITIGFSYDRNLDDYLRSKRLIDSTSISIYEYTEPYEIKFKGLHGDINTLSTLTNQFNALRDRYSGPPLKINLSVFNALNDLEVGDVVFVDLEQVRDYTKADTGELGTVDLQRSFEVLQVGINWFNGNGAVNLSLQGSSLQADSQPIDLNPGAIISDAYYSSRGTALNTVLSIDGSGNVTAPGTVTGGTTLEAGIYYYLGDLTIPAGITVTLTKNVLLMVRGFFDNKGTITTVGQGQAGVVASFPTSFTDFNLGTSGYLGPTTPDGGMNVGEVKGATKIRYEKGDYYCSWAPDTNYKYNVVPFISAEWDGTELKGLPEILWGSSGGSGGPLIMSASGAKYKGGDGGASGGGFAVVSRGASNTGKIITNGVDGTIGNSTTIPYGFWRFYSGSGAGGAPGAVIFILDGNNHVPPVIDDTNFEAKFGINPLPLGDGGATPYIGSIFDNYGKVDEQYGRTIYPSDRQGFTRDLSGRNGGLRVKHVTDNSVKEPEQADIAQSGTAVALVEVTNTPQTLSDNLATIEITVTPPSDTNYAYSNIYFKKTTDTEWEKLGPTFADERTATATMDGASYDIEARPVSKKGIEAPTGTRNTITMSSLTGGVSLGNDNYLANTKTSYADTATGFWLGNIGGAARFNIGNATEYMKWTGSALQVKGDITATTITADSGTIGGWTLTASKLSATGIDIDSANNRIRAYSGLHYTELSASGITAYSDTLGLNTVSIPSDGSSPTLSSGTVKEFTIEMYTTGVIQTDSNVPVNGGIRITKDYLQAYAPGALKTQISAATGAIQIFTDTTGQRIEMNPGNDNEFHFYGVTYGTTVEEAATIGISTVGSDTVIGRFGTVNSTKIGVYSLSNSSIAIRGISSSSYGVYGSSTTGVGVYGESNSTGIHGKLLTATGDGVLGQADFSGSNGVKGTTTDGRGVLGYANGSLNAGVGVVAQCTLTSMGPFKIVDSGQSTRPTHTADKGVFWLNNQPDLYINKDGSTTWNAIPRGNYTQSYAGIVASGGTWTKQPFSWSVTKTATGVYQITHNLGITATDQAIIATPLATSTGLTFCPFIYGVTTNLFYVYIKDDSNVAYDCGFSFILNVIRL